MNWVRTYPAAYSRYRSMKARCEDPKHPHYRDYGARGIKVCEEWKGPEGFKNYFLHVKSLGEKPSNSHQLDRKDNDGNYEPGNLQWATPRENLLNRRYLKPSNTGFKGVRFDEKRKKYHVHISYDHYKYFVGSFFTVEEAKLQFEWHWHILNDPSHMLNKYERRLKSQIVKGLHERMLKR
jgi:hypothetical protein